MFEEITIPTYVMNLKNRPDNLTHIRRQFEGRPEFQLNIVEAYRHGTEAVRHWQSMVEIVRKVRDSEDDVLIICEDDHLFTPHYDRERFIRHILDAAQVGAELLSGGIGGFANAFPISEHLFWIDWFRCMPFIVLYRPIFDKMIDYPFSEDEKADDVLSILTTHKMTIYPFVSARHDFGHSDLLRRGDRKRETISCDFQEADQKMGIYRYAYLKYLSESNRRITRTPG